MLLEKGRFPGRGVPPERPSGEGTGWEEERRARRELAGAPSNRVRPIRARLALLTVAAHPSGAPLASPLLAGAGPAEQPGGEEETGRDGAAVRRERAAGAAGGASPGLSGNHLHRRAAAEGLGLGLWGIGGTWAQQEGLQS